MDDDNKMNIQKEPVSMMDAERPVVVRPEQEDVKTEPELKATEKETKNKVAADDATVKSVPSEDDDNGERPESETERHIKKAIHEQAREDERPHSSNFTLRKILGGDILTAQMLRNNIGLIVLVVLFAVIYITNRYQVQKNLIELDKLKTELDDAKYRALSSSSNLTEKSRESHVLESLSQGPDSTLKMSDRPPYIIQVPDK